LDADVMTSGWVADLPAGEFSSWIKLLCLVKLSGTSDGSIKLSKMTEGFFTRYNISTNSWENMLKKAKADGAVVVTDGILTLSGWKLYQRDSTNAQRQARHRRKKKAESNGNVTGVTSRDVSNDNGTERDVDVTEQNNTTSLTSSGKNGGDNAAENGEIRGMVKPDPGVFVEYAKSQAKRQAGDTELVARLCQILGGDKLNHATWCKIDGLAIGGKALRGSRAAITQHLTAMARAAVADGARRPAAAFLANVRNRFPALAKAWPPETEKAESGSRGLAAPPGVAEKPHQAAQNPRSPPKTPPDASKERSSLLDAQAAEIEPEK
jgi:hypothetical protein